MHSLSCFQLELQILPNAVHIHLQELAAKITGLLTSQIIFNVLHDPAATPNAVKYTTITFFILYLMYYI